MRDFRCLSCRLLLPLALLAAFCPAANAQLPASFTTNITVGAQTMTVNFTNHSIRSVNYAVQVQQADGSFLPFDPGPPSTYLGTVVGQPGAIACATLLTNGHFWAKICFEAGNEWLYFSGPSVRAFSRGSTNFNFYNYPSSSLVTATGGAGTNIYAAEVAVDSGWNHFNGCGQSVYLTAMAVEHSILSVNYFYLRDNGVLHRIGEVFIRADFAQDPYHSIAAAGGKLDACRVFLNANSTTHDVGAVVDSIGGGTAWVGVIGTGLRYSANGFNGGVTGGGENGDFSQVWRHEVGHNWNCLDYEGGQAEGGTIMNGNSLGRCSGPEENKIVNHRNSKLGILDNLGPYSFPLPPRASMDAGQIYQPGDVLIDVLKNDHSGNGLPLSLLTSNAASLRGGTVAISIGTGPDGRNQLLYTPPTNFTGTDKFAYRITDSAGRTGIGYSYVKVDPPIASPSPFDFAGNVPPNTDLSWTTFKPGSQYDIYLGTDSAVVAAANTNSPVFRGRQLSLTNDPGLLASATTYYWRVDVVMTNGVIVPGTVWRFTTAPSPLEANLLVHLTLDDADLTGSNLEIVRDVAYPENNFTTSNTEDNQSGIIGQAFAFNGSNSFSRSISADIIPQSSGGTVSAWMKTTGSGNGTYLVSVEGAWVLQYQSSGGILAFLDGSSSGNGTFGSGLNDGNWHHVLAANDGATTRLYLDGALAGTYSETIYNLGSLTRDTAVGASYDGGGNFFTGTIDDVGIWARGLSAAEAYFIYTNGLAGKTVEAETTLTRVGFEAAEGFTGYVSPNFAALGTKTDTFGAEWSGLAGDVHIWNRSDIPPSGVQCLKLGENNNDALCRVRFPGTTNGIGVVTFDYAAFSSSSDCDLSISYSNATSGGWVQIWSAHVADSTPWWETKPWPTATIPVFVTGDVDLLIKKVGVKGVLLDNFRVTSKTDFAPVFTPNPLTKAGATAGVAYAASLAQDIYDPTPGDTFTFSKIGGPAWLNVAANGSLTGTPSGADYGLNTFTVRVTDSTGKTGDATLLVNVSVSATTLMAGSVPNSGYNRFWAWFAADNSSSPNGAGADADAVVVTRWDDVRGAFDHDLARNSGGGGGTFRTNKVNGLPAINYTGTQNNWGAYNAAGEFQAMTNGYTIFVVARVNSHSATAYLFDGASGAGRVALRAITGSPARWQLQAVRTFNGPAINTTANSGPLVTNVFQVHSVQVSGTTMSHYTNGVLAGAGTFADGGTALPLSGLILSCDAGVANHMECDVPEVMTYAETLNSTDRAAVENYLLSKYALNALPPPNVPLITLSVVGTNLQFQIASQSGYNYVVQAATNLVPPILWSNVSTNAGTGGTLNPSVPINPATPQCFFRVWAY